MSMGLEHLANHPRFSEHHLKPVGLGKRKLPPHLEVEFLFGIIMIELEDPRLAPFHTPARTARAAMDATIHNRTISGNDVRNNFKDTVR
ncbi:MAG: hypothetical protein HYV03_00920 [Deltaproteobacteria bacterium]|nr:hypothetical protein [Deltaproteobacteria bacterium]